MIKSALQIPARALPKPASPLQRAGLTYERKLINALRGGAPRGIQIFHNLWFSYTDIGNETLKSCCPDLIIFDEGFDYVVVGEVKLTWTPLAATKLHEVYLPVVAKAFKKPTVGVVFCKNLLPSSPRPALTVSKSFASGSGLFHWIGKGEIVW